jgi:hypothetical protein
MRIANACEEEGEQKVCRKEQREGGCSAVRKTRTYVEGTSVKRDSRRGIYGELPEDHGNFPE